MSQDLLEWMDARFRSWQRRWRPVAPPLEVFAPPRHWTDDSRRSGVVITVPLIWIAFLLSLLIHGAAMWIWLPRMRLVAANPQSASQEGGPLAVKLAALPSQAKAAPTPTPTPPATPPPPPESKPPPMVLRPLPKPAPPVITARASPVPAIVAPVPTPSPAPVPTPAPVQTPSPPIPKDMDLSAYMAAKRQARGESESPATQGAASSGTPAETETERRDRIVAGNLAAVKTPNFGNDPRNGGGLFEIRRVTADSAEFMFFGWNKEIRRRVPQIIEVPRGANPTIQIAMVRKMIGIIRDYETGDFAWESRRLGRIITLSARPNDNGDLEAFMMREFFDQAGTPR